jgi:outer membrane receptor protein involved in Fe transport
MKVGYFVSCAAVALLSGGAIASAQQTAATSAPSAVSDTVPTSAGQDAAAASANGPSTGVEEVVVTAQRRSQSIESVPLTIQAFSGVTLDELHVNTTEDILKYTPNVTYGNNGPGQGNIFIRGLSAGFAGNQSSATIGTFPNVALYLDDQAMTFPSRNVDVYLVDMERVEVLEGPQGTLFGGGAEAGAVRYITNKPKMNVFEGNAEGMYGITSGGGDNSSINATFNIPIVEDKLAIRAVVYDDRRGGYIDNVQSTLTRSNQDLGNGYLNVSAKNGVCPNGGAPGPAGCTLASSPVGNNAAIAGTDSNPLTYQGARVAALYDINNDWNVLITEAFQEMDAEGSFADYPVGSDFQTLKPLQVTLFTPSYDKDKFENTSWTVNGKIGPLKVLYTGAFLNRHIDQQQDYSNYARSTFGTYYQCTGGATGFGTGPATCYSPDGYWHDTVKSTHLSNEVRVSTPDTWRLRGIAGFYQEQFRIDDVMNFNYKTYPDCTATNLAIAKAGGATCVADVATAPNSTANDPGVRGANTAFGEDTQRGYDQYALFGSVDFDIIPHVLTVTAGTRYYNYNEFEVGSVYATGTGCTDVPNGQCVGGQTNLDSHNDHVTYQGFKSNANITWNFAPHSLVYYTFSQGFRPGGFNRTTKSVIKDASGTAQFEEPNSYAPDSLTNNEIGLKTELFDRRLILNLSAYYMNWDNVQFGIYNPTEGVNTTFGINGANYDVKGIEAQFVARVTSHLTLQGSGSYNHDTQSNSPCLVGNIQGTASYGKCISTVLLAGATTAQAFTNPFGSIGSTPAFSPDFQGNIRGRYDFGEIGLYRPYATAGVSYTGSMYNQPATYPSGTGVLIPYTTQLRYEQPAYATFDAALGVKKDRWTAEIYGTNLFDSHASTFTSSAQFIKSEVPLRPRVVNVKVSASF